MQARLFVSSGGTLAKGSPLFILLAYMLLSVLVLFVVTAITEVAAYLPVSGGTMSYFGHRNVSNSLGFAILLLTGDSGALRDYSGWSCY